MRVLIVGASRGLGRALVEALSDDGHEVVGVSRTVPEDLGAVLAARWIAADFGDPAAAAEAVAASAPATLDVVIYNLGIWEPDAFSEAYDFADEQDATTLDLVATNIAGPLLLLRRLLPRLLESAAPRLLLTGSTSGLPRSGRPELAFGASKFALTGIADALREHYRDRRLAVTTLQLGNLNTVDALDVPVEMAAARGDGALIPLHDVVEVVRTAIGLSPAAYLREIVLPAILDERF
ncbi:SDR family oxidoreductase [Leucobacter rhizosphaerae]|uniref:SDR family oxidoreductase n=1 Tax=Leucobacter rhizosphaerae TaxID=2932245 RepID=A0ABY4FTF4_9MICO|nr:SDR family NAD(P)-dependent oxidoreductase [Leucobacter rhizosphaerae]UOQ59560.1 SDR family oxidoreductase [Leucobacter rhizosphaerae]